MTVDVEVRPVRFPDAVWYVHNEFTMNPDVKKKWVAALRSGEFAQCGGALGRDDLDGATSYCCLGVLCELAAQEGVVERVHQARGTGYKSEDDLYVNYADLPRSVQAWAGLNSGVPWVGVHAESGELDLGQDLVSLISLNDSHRCGFDEIADAIEGGL